MDLADKLFRGTATTSMLLWYFYFATPQFVYYIIPMSALVATLVTIGLMTKNSELVVMKACGVSLYRSAAPLLLFAARGERRAVRPPGTGARHLEPRDETPRSPDPGISGADLRPAEPPLDRGGGRRHLSLRVLRSARQSLHASDHLSSCPSRPGGSTRSPTRRRSAGRLPVRRRRVRVPLAGDGRVDSRIPDRHPRQRREIVGQVRRLRRQGVAARGAGLLQDRGRRGRPDDLRRS